MFHHEIHFIYGCFESGDPEVGMMVDGDEVFYGFFNSNVVDVVWTLPKYPPIKMNQIQKLLALEYVTNSEPWCKENLAWGQMAQPKIPKVKEAPESTIYPREHVKLGENNTLICFVNNFFPPPVKMYWKKNGMEVTKGTSLSRYYPNKDGTFHQFSTLSFTPEEGDIYACTVEHTSLEDPESYFWEHEVSEVIVSSAGYSVFCGMGLSLGLLGVATGTFLMVKRSKSN
ncbi:H-2 class II histocompatibility antigen, A-U alpha chain isoform X2 [Esox lucius]|uniref:H-2 class II histocompatibility antigen, A-U alpha chain isoform X2 n=1 Tax=Esox lucius TaxID=8010 RepID=UPI001476B1D0|nr:H-2 class II histocompatibility antigen, A-U alpha chain isoform X2 [Esox lucius]